MPQDVDDHDLSIRTKCCGVLVHNAYLANYADIGTKYMSINETMQRPVSCPDFKCTARMSWAKFVNVRDRVYSHRSKFAVGCDSTISALWGTAGTDTNQEVLASLAERTLV